jgi:hypothetical protein
VSSLRCGSRSRLARRHNKRATVARTLAHLGDGLCGSARRVRGHGGSRIEHSECRCISAACCADCGGLSIGAVSRSSSTDVPSRSPSPSAGLFRRCSGPRRRASSFGRGRSSFGARPRRTRPESIFECFVRCLDEVGTLGSLLTEEVLELRSHATENNENTLEPFFVTLNLGFK